MNTYDIEREKAKSSEIRRVFREMFPLVNESALPWCTSHIKDFLKDRIKYEIDKGTFYLISNLVKILSEVSPPKDDVASMAAVAVQKAKLYDELQAKYDEMVLEK